MTAQYSDTIIFEDKKYALIGKKGPDLFNPEKFGIKATMMSTACYRGFYATYVLTRVNLLLDELTIMGTGDYPLLAGIKAKNEDDEAIYRKLNMVVPFSGLIRIARGFIEEYYIHMGFQKATAYKTVFDITLENGQVVELKDRSLECEEKRGAFKKKYTTSNISDRIDMAFSLDPNLDLE